MSNCEFSGVKNELKACPVDAGCLYVRENKACSPMAIVPEGFCPALFYAAIPYMLVLKSGGWMRWVKRLCDKDARSPIVPDTSKIKNVNRLFVNEVMVQCQETLNGVVIGIGPAGGKEKSLRIRVLDTKGDCPIGLKVGTEYLVDAGSKEFCMEAFYRLYPYLMLKDGLKNLPFKDADGAFAIKCGCEKGGAKFIKETSPDDRKVSGVCGDYGGIKVRVNGIENACRYHDKPVEYLDGCSGADKLCPDAFHAVYPYALALLYEADFLDGLSGKGKVKISCPAINGATFLIERKCRYPRLVFKTLKILEKIFEVFFYPVDKIYHDISITVTEANNSCACKYRTGDKFHMNIRSKKVMCPASFSSVYPALIQKRYGPRNAAGACHAHCPDCQGAGYVVESYDGRKGK